MFRRPSGFANGHTRDRDGRLLGCSHQHRCITRTELDWTVSVLADRYEGKRLNGPNDLVCRPDGSIWFTDPHYVVADDFTGPNGLCFTPDERRLYVAETGAQFAPDPLQHIRVYDVLDGGGLLSAGRIFHKVQPGYADGFRCDEDGNLWSGAADGVHCIDQDGVLLGRIKVPLQGGQFVLRRPESLPLVHLRLTHAVRHFHQYARRPPFLRIQSMVHARPKLATLILLGAGVAVLALARPSERKQVSKDANRPRHRVVIVGAGFGGLNAALRLAGRREIDLTLIDAHNHHLFQPLLYQVATAALSPADIASPIRGIVPASAHARVLMATVSGVDTAARQVLCGGDTVPYDELIIATGSRPSYFGHDAWAAAAPGLKTLGDALALRGQILASFERAAETHDRAERGRLLSFVLIGGGPTGVEMAGSIAELARDTLTRDYDIRDMPARIILVEAGPRILPAFPSDLSANAVAALTGLGVEVRAGTRVTRLEVRAGPASRRDGAGGDGDLDRWDGGYPGCRLARRQAGPWRSRGGRRRTGRAEPPRRVRHRGRSAGPARTVSRCPAWPRSPSSRASMSRAQSCWRLAGSRAAAVRLPRLRHARCDRAEQGRLPNSARST